jgi:hypothetical protein
VPYHTKYPVLNIIVEVLAVVICRDENCSVDSCLHVFLQDYLQLTTSRYASTIGNFGTFRLAFFQSVHCVKKYTRDQIVQCETKNTVETNISHVSQLLVFIRIISSDGNSKKLL